MIGCIQKCERKVVTTLLTKVEEGEQYELCGMATINLYLLWCQKNPMVMGIGIGKQVAISKYVACNCYLPCESLHQDEQGELAMWFACLISPPCKAPAIYITSNAMASSTPSGNKFDFDSLPRNKRPISYK